MKSTLKMRPFAYPILSLLVCIGIYACNPTDCCFEGTIAADTDALIFDWNETGVPQTITLASNMTWILKDALPAGFWISVNQSSGGSGVTTIDVTINDDNTDPSDRDFTLTFLAANGATTTVTVTQKGKPPFYDIGFDTDFVTINGVTATGTASVSSSPAGETITVTITLTNAADDAGVHSVNLTSTILGGSIVAPLSSLTRTFGVGDPALATDTYTFTFPMPAENVLDLVVEHTFSFCAIGDYTGKLYIDFDDVFYATTGGGGYGVNKNNELPESVELYSFSSSEYRFKFGPTLFGYMTDVFNIPEIEFENVVFTLSGVDYTLKADPYGPIPLFTAPSVTLELDDVNSTYVVSTQTLTLVINDSLGRFTLTFILTPEP